MYFTLNIKYKMEYLNPNELKKSIQKYFNKGGNIIDIDICLLYTSPSPRD